MDASVDDTVAISVIIPTLNEEAFLHRTLAHSADPRAERIVVDGGSTDGTAEIAFTAGVAFHRVVGGRAAQMNLGARKAHGAILLFLHADTLLPPDYCSQVLDITSREGVAAGAFRLRIEGSGPSLRLIETMANLRSTLLQLPYGDQALFLTAKQFREAGGFRPLPIMEDFELVRRLRSGGGIAIAASAVRTSARRWEEVGPWRTTLINQLMILGFLAGRSPERMARFYRARVKPTPKPVRQPTAPAEPDRPPALQRRAR